MNKMDKALREIGEMDELAARSSPVHDLSAPAKLLSTIAYIITVVSFDKYDLSGLVPLLLWPVLLFTVSGIPVRTCFFKLRIVLPLVMAVGLFNPLFDRHIILRLGTLAVSGGTVSMLTLMLKGVLCLMASFLLVATTPFDSICAALRRLHVPKTLVTLLLLTYRYVGVMTEELQALKWPRQAQAWHRGSWACCPALSLRVALATAVLPELIPGPQSSPCFAGTASDSPSFWGG